MPKKKTPEAPGGFDIDAAREKFRPVVVKFRGTEYALGTTAYSVVTLPDMLKTDEDDGDEAKVMATMLARLPEMLGQLSPELGEAIKEHGLEAAEEMAFMAAVQEVMNAVGRWDCRTA